MVMVNWRLERNVFWSILLFAIFSCTLFSGTAFCEEAAEAVLTQSDKNYAQAEILFKSGKFAEAKDLYEYVPQNSSDSNLKFWAQMQVICCEISLGNDSAAEQAITKSKKDFVQNGDLFTGLLMIADRYGKMKKSTKAKDLWQYVSQNTPDASRLSNIFSVKFLFV